MEIEEMIEKEYYNSGAPNKVDLGNNHLWLPKPLREILMRNVIITG